jgi:hypothetical protein
VISERIQYILLDGDGNEVERWHQDDESDTIASSTIQGLLDHASERVADMGLKGFLEELTDKDSDFYGYRVVRQEVKTFELNTKEQAELERISDYDEDADYNEENEE